MSESKSLQLLRRLKKGFEVMGDILNNIGNGLRYRKEMKDLRELVLYDKNRLIAVERELLELENRVDKISERGKK